MRVCNYYINLFFKSVSFLVFCDILSFRFLGSAADLLRYIFGQSSSSEFDLFERSVGSILPSVSLWSIKDAILYRLGYIVSTVDMQAVCLRFEVVFAFKSLFKFECELYYRLFGGVYMSVSFRYDYWF